MRIVHMVFLGFLIIVAGCNDGSPHTSSTPPATATSTPSATEPTANPTVQQVIRAVQVGDIDALVDLTTWLPTACGSPHGATDLCPEGIEQGTNLPMVYAGFADTFLVTEETLRDGLEQVLGDRKLAATYLAEAYDMTKRDGSTGDFVLLGMEGEPVPVDAHVFWGDAGQKTGVFLLLDASSSTPIVEIGFLSETWTAAQQGAVFADEPPTQ